jgi:hypothetical protein
MCSYLLYPGRKKLTIRNAQSSAHFFANLGTPAGDRRFSFLQNGLVLAEVESLQMKSGIRIANFGTVPRFAELGLFP